MINTEGTTDGSGGNPFNQTTVIVTTADKGIDQRIRAAARAPGYRKGIMNTQVLPQAILNMGLENTSDTFAVILRPAYKDPQAGDDYLNNPPSVIFRVTPREIRCGSGRLSGIRGARGTGKTEYDLTDDLDELKMAVLNKYRGLYATEPVLDSRGEREYPERDRWYDP